MAEHVGLPGIEFTFPIAQSSNHTPEIKASKASSEDGGEAEKSSNECTEAVNADQIPATTKKQKLTDFFMKETADEKEDRLAHDWEELRNTSEKRERNVQLKAEEKARKICEGSWLRQCALERVRRSEENEAKKRLSESRQLNTEPEEKIFSCDLGLNIRS